MRTQLSLVFVAVLSTTTLYSSLYSSAVVAGEALADPFPRGGRWSRIKNFLRCLRSRGGALDQEGAVDTKDYDSVSGSDADESSASESEAEKHEEGMVRIIVPRRSYAEEKIQALCAYLHFLWHAHAPRTPEGEFIGLSTPCFFVGGERPSAARRSEGVVGHDGCYFNPGLCAAPSDSLGDVLTRYTVQKLDEWMMPLQKDPAATQELYYFVHIFMNDYIPAMIQANPDSQCPLNLLWMGLRAWQIMYACDRRFSIMCNKNVLIKVAYSFFEVADDRYGELLGKICHGVEVALTQKETLDIFEGALTMQKAYQYWCLKMLVAEHYDGDIWAARRIEMTVASFHKPEDCFLDDLRVFLGPNKLRMYMKRWNDAEKGYSHLNGWLKGCNENE